MWIQMKEYRFFRSWVAVDDITIDSIHLRLDYISRLHDVFSS